MKWEDPTKWVAETYPWSDEKHATEALLRLRANDVGYDLATGGGTTTPGNGAADNLPPPTNMNGLPQSRLVLIAQFTILQNPHYHSYNTHSILPTYHE